MNKAILFIGALILPAFLAAQSQTIGFGLQKDTAGGFYFIRQIATKIGDTTETKAVTIRYTTANEAMAAINIWREVVSTDSATIVKMYRDNTRQRQQLDGAAAELKPLIEPTTPAVPVNMEAEIERLRKENEALKKQTGKQ